MPGLVPDNPNPSGSGAGPVAGPLSSSSSSLTASSGDSVYNQEAVLEALELENLLYHENLRYEEEERQTSQEQSHQATCKEDGKNKPQSGPWPGLNIRRPASPSTLGARHWVHVDQWGYPVNLIRLAVVPGNCTKFRPLSPKIFAWPTDQHLIDLAAEARERFRKVQEAEKGLTDKERETRAEWRKAEIQKQLPEEFLSMVYINHGRLLGLMLWRWGLYNFFVQEVSST